MWSLRLRCVVGAAGDADDDDDDAGGGGGGGSSWPVYCYLQQSCCRCGPTLREASPNENPNNTGA